MGVRERLSITPTFVLPRQRLCRNWWNIQSKPVQSIAERTMGFRVIVLKLSVDPVLPPTGA